MDFEVWPGPMEGVGRGEFVRSAVKLKLSRLIKPLPVMKRKIVLKNFVILRYVLVESEG